MQSKSVVLNAQNGDPGREAPEAELGGHVPSAQPSLSALLAVVGPQSFWKCHSRAVGLWAC